MKTEKFNEIVACIDSMSLNLMEKKTKDYARDGDRLDNFKTACGFLGIPARIVWGVYFFKHVSAIMTWARTGKLNSETLEGRFLDLLNYVRFGYALAVEEGDLPVPQDGGFFGLGIDQLIIKKEGDLKKHE